jgi:hypothetical protein
MEVEDGVIKLQMYNYGGIDIVLFGDQVVFKDKLYDGLEISIFGDPRDAEANRFDAKLITPHTLLLKVPAVNRGMQDCFAQCMRGYRQSFIHGAILKGHQLACADRSENENCCIRFVTLTFPTFYTLSNDIFSPNLASGNQQSSQIEYIVTGYTYEHHGTTVKCGFVRAAWYFHKYTRHAPRLTAKVNQEDEAVAAMNETFRGMNTNT